MLNNLLNVSTTLKQKINLYKDKKHAKDNVSAIGFGDWTPQFILQEIKIDNEKQKVYG